MRSLRGVFRLLEDFLRSSLLYGVSIFLLFTTVYSLVSSNSNQWTFFDSPSGQIVPLRPIANHQGKNTHPNSLLSQQTGNQVMTNGPLFVHPTNPRYFSDGSGQAIALTGSHTWCNFMDCGSSDPPSVFDYEGYLDFLEVNGHNFFRLWRAENARGGETGDNFWFDPMPYQRPGPGTALDGKPKFDLDLFNQAYFDRMRSHIIEAGQRGIYVSIMLFDGWSIESKMPNHDPWRGHPFNGSNNINGVNGDINGNGQGEDTHTLANPAVTALQEAYVRKVIDTVNDLDNVLYEISNESHGNATEWQYHMIDFIRQYEATKPKQHPIGMTVEYPGGNNDELFASAADWISLNGDINNPPVADGSKVILADTDHLCGICGNYQWVWKSFTRGENPLFMDPYDPSFTGRGAPPGYDPNNPNDVSLRLNMGYTHSYAERMNLAEMIPRGDLCSTQYCLANAVSSGAEYLVYLPQGGTIQVNLSAASGELLVEWLNPATGAVQAGPPVMGGAARSFTPPFSGDAVLYVYAPPTSTATPSPTSTSSATPTNTPTHTPTATGTLTHTPTPTATATGTLTHTPTPTATATGTLTHTPTSTRTPIITPSATVTGTLITPTSTATGTLTSTPSQTPVLTATVTATPVVCNTPTPTPSVTPVGGTPTSTPTGEPAPGYFLFLPVVIYDLPPDC